MLPPFEAPENNLAKPAITSAQLLKAKDYIKAGGSIDAIKNKYKLTASEEKTLNG